MIAQERLKTELAQERKEAHLIQERLEAELAQAREGQGPLLSKFASSQNANEAMATELKTLENSLEAERKAARETIRSLKDSIEALQKNAETGAPVAPVPPTIEGLSDPVWDKIIPGLRRPVTSAFNRLRQLPLAAIPEGPRAMIRLAAASLTQASDTLKALEEYFDEDNSPPAPARAEVPIDAALASWDRSFRQRRITIVRRVDLGLPHVLIREESLRVAVFQILRNAHDAMPAGGTLNVQISRNESSGGVTARFSDTGPGFSPRALETLFTPFSNARSGHLGLGLSLARKILRRYGGDLEAVNSPSKGALITLLIAPADALPPLTDAPGNIK